MLNQLITFNWIYLIDCFIYNKIKSIKGQYTFNLVAHYLKDSFIKFYKKNKNNDYDLIIPAEFNNSNSTLVFAVGFFYILNPKLFSPRWEKIAKNVYYY